MEKDKRFLNVSFSKTQSSLATRVSIPITWLKDMGISQEDRKLEVEYDYETKTITLKKWKKPSIV